MNNFRKKVKILFCILIFLSVNVYSQESYKILYEAKGVYPNDSNINSRALETFRRSRNITTEFSLSFNRKESVFLRIEKINNSQEKGAVIRPGTFINTYNDYEKNEYIHFMNNSITEKGKITDLEWKKTGISKTILDFVVNEYVYKEGDLNVSIWVNESFKIDRGPLNYSGYKGVVLELEKKYIQNGYNMSVIYTAIQLEKIKEIKKPKLLN